MTLSRESVAALSDLIENRLAVMQVSDRDDLRQIVALKRALTELHAMEPLALHSADTIPTRGRHKKFATMKHDVLGDEQAPISA